MFWPGQILPGSAQRFGDKVALVTADRSLTYRELDELSDRVAAGLAARGVRPGEVVSLYAQNRWEWIVSYHGVLKAGAVVNPVNVMLTEEELAYQLRDCESVAVLASADHAARAAGLVGDLPELRTVIAFGEAGKGEAVVPFAELLASGGPAPDVKPDPGARCAIGYTSGTTGHPKGAVQAHRAVLLNCSLAATMHGKSERDVVLTALSAAHAYGVVVVNSTLLTGGTLVLMERFAPAEVLRLIEAHRVTVFEGVPTMYTMLLADKSLGAADLSSLTRCTVAGQTIARATVARWQERSGAPMIEHWGMTEISGLGVTHAVYAPPVPGSCGVSLPGVEIRVADLKDVTRDAPRGEPGELMTRSPMVMLEYLNNPVATAQTIEPDGWLHTGDIAIMDTAGYVFIVDRLKDMINTAGYKVYPAEIERVLGEHPGVAMVGVGPVPDPLRGELACAYVIRAEGSDLTGEELVGYARLHLAAYKVPRLVQFVSSLPRTSSGKIMRRELIKSFDAGAAVAKHAR